MSSQLLKRALDILLSFVLLIVASPLIIGLAVVTWSQLGSPIMFRQVRPGLHGLAFVLYKFRTMKMPRDTSSPISDAERLTTFGRLMRSSSLDELPELFNVLKGDMSLVGPRPLLMAYLARYTPQQARRHEVKPGITGWAQVNGRNALSWRRKFELDVWYVDHWTVWLDLKIIFRTVAGVLRREGINAAGYATMPEFAGESEDTDGT